MASVETSRPRTLGRGGARGEAERRLPRSDTALLCVGIAINVAVVLAARHFPYQDGANHLARYVLLDRAWWGIVPPEVHARLLPTPYIALDLLGAALVHVLGPDLALRTIVLLAVLLLPVGMYLLLRQTAPHRRAWALVGVLFGLSWYLLDGLLNFVVGAGLVLIWLAWWWPRRDGNSVAARLALAAGAAGLFLVHLSAPLSVLVVVWIDCALAVLARFRSSTADRPGARVRSRALTAVVITAAVFGLWAAAELMIGRSRGGDSTLAFRSATLKLAALGAPFYAFDLGQALVLAGGWVASLGAFVFLNRFRLRVDALVVSAVAFLVLFAVSPESVGAAGGVDVRWLIFAYLLPFCATEGRPDPSRSAPSQRVGLAVTLAAAAIHAGVVWREVQRRDPLLDEFDEVLAHVPAGARLLPIVADGASWPRVGVYDEFAFWHVIRNAGQVPGLFNFNNTRPDDEPFRHFAHFEIVPRRYVPPFHWGVRTFEPLDWAQIDRDYDYIVQAGTDPRVTHYLSNHAQVRRRDGSITLYAAGPHP